jgi:hypothetical protein
MDADLRGWLCGRVVRSVLHSFVLEVLHPTNAGSHQGLCFRSPLVPGQNLYPRRRTHRTGNRRNAQQLRQATTADGRRFTQMILWPRRAQRVG